MPPGWVRATGNHEPAPAPYRPLPPPGPRAELLSVAIADLQPTQMCVGLAEVRSRQQDFSQETAEQRLRYLRGKPVPLVRGGSGELWMVDRHHRLRGLIEIDPTALAYGYLVLDLPGAPPKRCWPSCRSGAGCTSMTAAAMARWRRRPCRRGCRISRTIPTARWCGDSRRRE